MPLQNNNADGPQGFFKFCTWVLQAEFLNGNQWKSAYVWKQHAPN
jgi:hypothetical protein